MHSFAHSQKPLASADDRGISALGEIDLIFDHLHHGLAGARKFIVLSLCSAKTGGIMSA